MMGTFSEQLHPRGTGAQGGQFVAKGTSTEKDTVGYDSKAGTGAGYGSKNGDARVKTLQRVLNTLGVTDSAGKPLLVDGKLGPKTTAAIKRLQRKMGLAADGRVTPAFLAKIKQLKPSKHTQHAQHQAHQAHQHRQHQAHASHTAHAAHQHRQHRAHAAHKAHAGHQHQAHKAHQAHVAHMSHTKAQRK